MESGEEYEVIRLGSWEFRIPSRICTDYDIFSEIFSANTWNNILSPEQRRRISEMLPQELQTPAEASTTMDALFSNKLVRFGSAPLPSFFAKLDAGHFDPSVVETKQEIFKVWRKDAVRRTKMYHTKLLQEIIQERELLLKSSIIRDLPLTNGVENRPLKRMNCGELKPVVKKQLPLTLEQSNIKPMTKILVTIPVPNVAAPNPPATSNLTALQRNNSRKEQAAATLAKFPKILPAPNPKPMAIQTPASAASMEKLKEKPSAQVTKVQNACKPLLPKPLPLPPVAIPLPVESSSSSDDEFESIEPTIGFEAFTTTTVTTTKKFQNVQQKAKPKPKPVQIPVRIPSTTVSVPTQSHQPRKQAVNIVHYTTTTTTLTSTPIQAISNAIAPIKMEVSMTATTGPKMVELANITIPNFTAAATVPLSLTQLPNLSQSVSSSDLSIMENPFDSIPNLSDELDGFDLDLVDGLCDFDSLLSDEKRHQSFFSLIRDVLCSTRDHRMTLASIERTIHKWSQSSSAKLNPWYSRVQDWNAGLLTGLNFLAGSYQGSFHVHPEDFVPYIEYKYKTKFYQWIGAGRDSDANLSPLCNMWLDNLDKLPALKKQEESELEPMSDIDSDIEEVKKKNKRPTTPPPPRCVTDWQVRPSTDEEKIGFQGQERARFESPHKAFTYVMHEYESVVGPVKGVYSSQSGLSNKARGHSLLVDERPPYVTILALVRDAVARLPNGEGTRSEICEMLRDSAYLAAEASNVTLNSVVSGALDRLHYERDPCVRYDSHKKSWIYLHRDRSQEQFERLHHNRSYTKSTKSRSNTCRKSRRMKQQGSSSSNTSTSTPTPSSSKESGTGKSSDPLLLQKPKDEIEVVVKAGGLQSKPPLVGTRVGDSDKKPIVISEKETVQMLGTAIMKGWGSDSTTSSVASSSQTVQAIVTSTSASSATVPNATTTATMAPRHIILGANTTMLRFATNLRFEGLRFAQGQLRLPQQHRFLLARPGSNAQPLIVGQTSTGQTIILSGSLAAMKASVEGDRSKSLNPLLATSTLAPPVATSITVSAPSSVLEAALKQPPISVSSGQQGAPTGGIIIRSSQGGFTLPSGSTQFTLQQQPRVLQGLKVITGKSMLAARLISPPNQPQPQNPSQAQDKL